MTEEAVDGGGAGLGTGSAGGGELGCNIKHINVVWTDSVQSTVQWMITGL